MAITDPKDTTQTPKPFRDPWAPSNTDITIWQELGVTDPFLLGFQKEQATLGMYLSAKAGQAFDTNPVPALGRMQQLINAADEPPPPDENAEFGYDPTAAGVEFVRTKPRITEDEWKNNPDLYHANLDFKKMASDDGTVTIEKAKLLKKWKEEELYQNEVIARGPDGVGVGLLGLATSFFVSAIDPINLASAFVPVVRAGAAASMAMRMGKTGGLLAKGAIEGAVGNAMVEPIILAAAKAGQMDYTYYDSAVNIAFGTVLGAGLHTGIGKYADWAGVKSVKDAENQMRLTAYAIEKDLPIGQQLDVARKLAKIESDNIAHIRDLPTLEKEYKITYTPEEVKARQDYDAQTKKYDLYDAGGRVITDPEIRRYAIVDKIVEEQIAKTTFATEAAKNQARILMREAADIKFEVPQMRTDTDFVVLDKNGREVMDPVERKRIIEEEILPKANEEKVKAWQQNNKYDEDQLVSALMYKERVNEFAHRLPFNDSVKATVIDIFKGNAVSSERLLTLKKALSPAFNVVEPRMISDVQAMDAIKTMAQDYLLSVDAKKLKDYRTTKEFQDIVNKTVKEAAPEAGLPKLPEDIKEDLIVVGATTQDIVKACNRDVDTIKKLLYKRAQEGDTFALNAVKKIEIEESKLRLANEKNVRAITEILDAIDKASDPFDPAFVHKYTSVAAFKQLVPDVYHKLMVDFGDPHIVDDLLKWVQYEYRQDLLATKAPNYAQFAEESGLGEVLRNEGIIANVLERINKVEQINLRSMAYNEVKVVEMENHIKMAKDWAVKNQPGDAKHKINIVKEAISSYIWGSLSRLPGSKLSINSRILGYNGKFQGGLINDLERAKSVVDPNVTLWDKANSRDADLNRNVARELWEFDKVEGKKGFTGDKDALAIAEIFHKYQELAVDRILKNGVTITKLPGYIVKQTHNKVKISKVSYEDWRNDILPRLDEKQTFGTTDKDEFLKSVYDNIVSGHYTVFDNHSDVSIRDNLGARISAQRQLFFKSADDWYDYNQKFGDGEDLLPSVQKTLERMAKNLGVMDALGPTPQMTMNTVIKHLKEEHSGDAKMLHMLESKSKEWDSAIEVALGLTDIPENPTIGAWGNSLRAIQNTSKLGSAFLSALTDIPFFASEIHFQGGSLLYGYYTAIMNIGRGRGALGSNRRETARLIGVGLDGIRGSVLSRFTGTDSYARNRIEQANNLIFKISGLNYWTDAQKTGFGLMLANYLASNADHNFDSLNKGLRQTFQMYGINATDWDVLRTKGLYTADDGTKFITTKNLIDTNPELEDKLRMYMIDSTERAVPTPGLRERMILKGGIFGHEAAKAGTVWGEAVRCFSQFKSFPLTVTRSVLGRELITREGLGSKIGGVTQLIIGTTILGYAASAAKDLSKGRTPQDPRTWDSFGRSFIQGGGIGILSDFLFSMESRYGAGPLETVMGPTYGTATDVFNLMSVMRKSASDGIDPDDDSKPGRIALAAIRLAKNNTPFANLWWGRSVIDHALWNTLSEAASPGYKHRM